MGGWEEGERCFNGGDLRPHKEPACWEESAHGKSPKESSKKTKCQHSRNSLEKKRNSLVCPKDAHSPTAGGGGPGWGGEMESKRQAEGQVRQDPGGRGLEFDLQCKRSPCRGEGKLQEDRVGWGGQSGGGRSRQEVM